MIEVAEMVLAATAKAFAQLNDQHPRLFLLYRHEDATGVSGTGIVAEGCQFSDGRVALRWTTDKAPSSTAVYDSIGDVEAIHGHDGRTELVWL